MRIYRLLALLIMGVLLLPHSDLEAMQISEVQQIQIWHPEVEERAEALQQLVDEFNAEHEGQFAVQLSSMTNRGLLYDRIILQLASVEPVLPNLAITWGHEAALYGLSGRVVDLNPYYDRMLAEAELTSDFLPVMDTWGVNPQDGVRYAMPVRGIIPVLMVNMDALRELGAEVPVTLEALIETSCAFQQSGGWSEASLHAAYGFLIPNNAFILTALVNAQGRPAFSSTPELAYTFNTPEMNGVLAALLQGYEAGCLQTRTTPFEDLDRFTAGHTLFFLGTSADLAAVESGIANQFAVPFEWQVFALPGGGSGYTEASMLVMFDQGETLNAAAWQFVAWMLQPEINARWNMAMGTLPVRKSAARIIVESGLNLPQWQQVWGHYQVAANTTVPALAGHEVVRLQMEQAVRLVFQPEQTRSIEDILETLNSQANQALVDFAPDLP